MIEAGVAGFISKATTQEQLITSIRCALRDEVVISIQLLRQLRRINATSLDTKGQENSVDILLTDKEQQILDGVSRGLTNKVIAINLSMSQRTVEHHLTKIFSK